MTIDNMGIYCLKGTLYECHAQNLSRAVRSYVINWCLSSRWAHFIGQWGEGSSLVSWLECWAVKKSQDQEGVRQGNNRGLQIWRARWRNTGYGGLTTWWRGPDQVELRLKIEGTQNKQGLLQINLGANDENGYRQVWDKWGLGRGERAWKTAIRLFHPATIGTRTICSSPPVLHCN